MKKKTVALLLACVMVLGVAIGGSLAWLTDTSGTVTNTFTDSDINIALEETTENYKMIPGWTIAKDPKVTIEAGSEACYVFVKIEKSANYDSYLEQYKVDSAWQQLKDKDNNDIQGVYYQKLTTIPSTGWFDYVLAAGEGANANGYVTVRGTVTKEMMDAIDGIVAEGGDANAEINARPTLTFTAYASQLKKDNSNEFQPYEAWNNVQSTVNP